MINNNLLINGNFDLWQKGITFSIPYNAKYSNVGISGTTLTAQSEFVADRWYVIDTQQRDGGSTGSITIYQEILDSTNEILSNSDYGITILNQITGITIGYCYLENKEADCNKYSGNSLYLTFSAKQNGAGGATLGCYFRQVYNSPKSQFYNVFSTINISEYWTTYTAVLSPQFIASGLSGDHYFSIGFRIPPQTNISIAGVKLEQNIVGGTPIYSDPVEEKQRQSKYYQTTYPTGYTAGSITLQNENDLTALYFNVTPNYSHNYKFDVQMYKTPTISFYSPKSGIKDGYNKSANKDMRLTSGTRGWNSATRFSPTGSATLVASGNTYGVQLNIASGAVVFDDILVHIVADCDLNYSPYDKGLET